VFINHPCPDWEDNHPCPSLGRRGVKWIRCFVPQHDKRGVNGNEMLKQVQHDIIGVNEQ